MTKNTTANEPIEAIDPGGTKPAKPSPDAKQREPEQKVKSGDRNTMPKKK